MRTGILISISALLKLKHGIWCVKQGTSQEDVLVLLVAQVLPGGIMVDRAIFIQRNTIIIDSGHITINGVIKLVLAESVVGV